MQFVERSPGFRGTRACERSSTMKTPTLINVVAVLLVIIPVTSYAQWAPTDGPYGGRVNSLSIDGARALAGTEVGVFVSSDSGRDWTAANTGLTSKAVSSVSIVADSSGDTVFFAGVMNGIFRSTDDGKTWSATNVSVEGITSFLAFPADTGGTLILAGTTIGMYLSADMGASWNTANNGLLERAVTSLTAIPTGSGHVNLYAGTAGGGVFLSTDQAADWTPVDTGWPANIPIVASLSSSSLSGGGYSLVAGTNMMGIFLSTDLGSSWHEINDGLPDTSISCVSTSDSDIFVGTTDGTLFFSSDLGADWSELVDHPQTGSINCLSVDSASGSPRADSFQLQE